LHRRRAELSAPSPAHVTLRVRRGVPNLRSRRLVQEFRRSLQVGCERDGFRVLHYSIQRDHAHFVVEADSREALASGMKSIGARLARAVNRIFGRVGAVLDGRYHLRVLATPREVRSAFAYVLLNARKHWRQRYGEAPPVRLDAASSARWFDGWRDREAANDASHDAWPERPEVATARTWLARVGWRQYGLIDPSEVPGRA
jgi:REP element-mobilizing transposase RayT